MTGVQTCALPISREAVRRPRDDGRLLQAAHLGGSLGLVRLAQPVREVVARLRELLERQVVESVELPIEIGDGCERRRHQSRTIKASKPCGGVGLLRQPLRELHASVGAADTEVHLDEHRGGAGGAGRERGGRSRIGLVRGGAVLGEGRGQHRDVGARLGNAKRCVGRLLERGRLTEELQAVGFGPLEAVKPAARQGDEVGRAARERVTALRTEARRLSAEAQEAERELAEAELALQALREEATQKRADATRAAEELGEAEDALSDRR